MTTITAKIVKELREKTGAGMMDCKKALMEVEGQIEAAIDWLRKKGLASASKKSGRVAAEGAVCAVTSNLKGVLIEVNSETDFVSRNESFQQFVHEVSQKALHETASIEALKELDYGNGRTVEEENTQLVATIGENIVLRRAADLSVEKGLVTSYVHGSSGKNMGRIGVLVALEADTHAQNLTELGEQIAMHVAATAPQSLDVESLDSQAVEREKAIFIEQAEKSGRPADIIEKMVGGRLNKFYQEVVLLEQAFVIDGKTAIKEVLAQKSKQLNTPVKLAGFKRFALGEGIEKSQDDFAEEVNRMAGKP